MICYSIEYTHMIISSHCPIFERNIKEYTINKVHEMWTETSIGRTDKHELMAPLRLPYLHAHITHSLGTNRKYV